MTQPAPFPPLLWPPSSKPHRGPLILSIGIAGILVTIVGYLLCCTISPLLPAVFALPLGTLAWTLGNVDLNQMTDGLRNPDGYNLTLAGKISGIISVLLASGLVAIALMGAVFFYFAD